MQIDFITKEDLKQFKAELVQELKEALIGKVKPTGKEWLKSQEVRVLLGISPGTLQNLRINGTLPFTKIGGMLYYRQEDITKLLEKGVNG
ncbi:helix-turn-helix protein [Mucilaginibacter gracilis]|uniref:Helix-turn-helix protein n=1 Tax=Mucilaginibacter gracilis TaxID=423350 RepID=A0A495IV14_9SPHI|nr:helix-turn-helix domain-containing protein [Mucilaginibacter gracilis]RKR80151.1 helix-turn-helix protein [Mucilaginibacter gracilis]